MKLLASKYVLRVMPMQAAAGPPVFEVLRKTMALGFECFASPLNAHFERYGSAFPDVDGPFGSAGSFFR
jgi:phosphorylated CTD-interacting factor 1